LRPLEIVFNLNGLVVFVDTKQRHIQIVTGEVEVVGISSEKRDRKLRSKDQPHVSVLLVAIKIVLSALVERNHIASQTGLLGGFFFYRGDSRLPRCVGFRG